jgi:hypothetical protein
MHGASTAEHLPAHRTRIVAVAVSVVALAATKPDFETSSRTEYSCRKMTGDRYTLLTELFHALNSEPMIDNRCMHCQTAVRFGTASTITDVVDDCKAIRTPLFSTRVVTNHANMAPSTLPTSLRLLVTAALEASSDTMNAAVTPTHTPFSN